MRHRLVIVNSGMECRKVVATCWRRKRFQCLDFHCGPFGESWGWTTVAWKQLPGTMKNAPSGRMLCGFHHQKTVRQGNKPECWTLSLLVTTHLASWPTQTQACKAPPWLWDQLLLTCPHGVVHTPAPPNVPLGDRHEDFSSTPLQLDIWMFTNVWSYSYLIH